MKLLLTFATILLTSAAWADDSFTQRNAGLWRGIGIQQGGTTWPLRVAMTEDIAAVSYPSLECGGGWAFSEQGPPFTIATEMLIYGFDACADFGEIWLTERPDGQLEVLWIYSQPGLEAVAVLHRETDAAHDPDTELRDTLQAWNKRQKSLR